MQARAHHDLAAVHPRRTMSHKKELTTNLPDPEESYCIPMQEVREIRETTDNNRKWAPTATENPRPLVPEQQCEATCVAHKITFQKLYNRNVLVLTFQLLDEQYPGVRLQRYLPVSKRAGRSSAYYREWVIANAGILPRRGDRLSPKKFHGKLFRVEVKTVRSGWHGRPLPETLCYSKVAAVLELLVTNESIQ